MKFLFKLFTGRIFGYRRGRRAPARSIPTARLRFTPLLDGYEDRTVPAGTGLVAQQIQHEVAALVSSQGELTQLVSLGSNQTSSFLQQEISTLTNTQQELTQLVYG